MQATPTQVINNAVTLLTEVSPKAAAQLEAVAKPKEGLTKSKTIMTNGLLTVIFTGIEVASIYQDSIAAALPSKWQVVIAPVFLIANALLRRFTSAPMTFLKSK